MKRLVLALLSLVVAGCSESTPLSPRVATLRRVAVLPPDVTVVRVTTTAAPEPLDHEAAIARRELPLALAGPLQSRGFTVVPARLDDGGLATQPELRKPLTTTLGRCNGARVAARNEEPAGSLGPDVAILAQHAGADALLCVVYDGTDRSGAQMANDVAAMVVTRGIAITTTSTALFVALVDGTTGDVHWRNRIVFRGLTYQGPQLLAVVDRLFADMPMRPGTP